MEGLGARFRRNLAGIYGILTVLAFAVLAGLRVAGLSTSAGNGIVHFWPVLILLWVLAKLAGERPPRFSNTQTIALILLIVAGTGLTAAAYLSPAVGNFFEMGDFSVWEMVPQTD